MVAAAPESAGGERDAARRSFSTAGLLTYFCSGVDTAAPCRIPKSAPLPIGVPPHSNGLRHGLPFVGVAVAYDGFIVSVRKTLFIWRILRRPEPSPNGPAVALADSINAGFPRLVASERFYQAAGLIPGRAIV